MMVQAKAGHSSMKPSAQPTRLGRPKGGNSDQTKQRVLDVAEALFAEGGYNGTSIRDIASGAEVAIAVVGYHFGPKAELFEAVIARRAGPLNAQRLQGLSDAKARGSDGHVEVAELVRMYVAPFIEYALAGNQGWQNYAALMGRLANSPLGTEVIARHYDAIAQTYIDALIETLPDADRLALVEGFMAMVSSMLFICATTGRLEKLALAVDAKMRGQTVIDNLIDFNSAGLLAVARQERHSQ